MPQIDQIASIYASQAFWLVVVFALIYFAIGRAMLPKIERTIEDRDARISGDLAAAEAARAAADAAEEAYMARLDASRGAAQAEMAAAKARATADAETRLKSADGDIVRRSAHAEAALAQSRAASIEALEQVTVKATREMVDRLTGIAVDRETVSAAVVDAMARV